MKKLYYSWWIPIALGFMFGAVFALILAERTSLFEGFFFGLIFGIVSGGLAFGRWLFERNMPDNRFYPRTMAGFLLGFCLLAYMIYGATFYLLVVDRIVWVGVIGIVIGSFLTRVYSARLPRIEG